MIIYTNSPDSIIKALLLSKLTGNILSHPRQTLTLLQDSLILNADDYCLKELASDFSSKYCVDTSWINTSRFSELKKLVHYAARNNSPDKYNIIFSAIEDAFLDGIEYCLQDISPYGKKMRTLARAVAHEVGYMLGFIRFKKHDESCLVATLKLYHDSMDTILWKLKARYPKHKLVLISGSKALAIEGTYIYEVDRHEFESTLKNDNFDEYWKEYYKSQYIESRKNIRLAAAKIPKRYWDWLPEGEILREEDK
ncbi:MAG: DUF4130 domain-containing protein [Bacillota bacterium]